MDKSVKLKTSIDADASYLYCTGCKCPTGLIKIHQSEESNSVIQLPASKHLVFAPNGKVFHLEKKCLEGHAPETMLANSSEIPADSHTSHSKANTKKEYTKQCSVCFEEEGVWLMMMPCTHMLCSECYGIWKNQSTKCPLCMVPNYGLKKSFAETNLFPPKSMRMCTQPPQKKQKILKPSVMLRVASSGCTQDYLSQPIDFNPINDYGHEVEISLYEQLRAEALGATEENPNVETTIAPISTANSLGDFSNVISGETGKVFITATTQQSVTYNDLNVTIFEKTETGYDREHFLSFSDINCELSWIKHSGDKVIDGSGDISDSVDRRYNKLQHGILIDLPNNHRIEIHFINENVEGSAINSTNANTPMHTAFRDMRDELIGNLGERDPKYIMFCSQITYITNHTLNSLSPNIAPSCGLILDRNIYACDWEDPTNMTGWACVMIYE
jgi:hypothetical protein